jgi:two-component system, NtrC family, sensor histidine kinase HydH
MRFATKLTSGFAVVCVATAVVAGAIESSRQRDELLSSQRHELTLIGSALAASVDRDARDLAPQRILEQLASIERADPDVDVVVFDREARPLARSPGARASDEAVAAATAALRSGEVFANEVVEQKEGEADQSRSLVALPFPGRSERVDGAVVVTRPLTEVEARLSAARRAIVGASLLLIGATTGLLFLLVRVHLTRPLRSLTEAMRRVTAGDLSIARRPPRRDEVGALALEFDRMVAELAAARRRVAELAESRSALERGLQRVDKLATLGQLSAGLAHEIGSPLQVMQGRARSLLTERSRDPAQVQRVASIVSEQADRITRIVEQLMRFARRTPPKLAPTGLEPPVRAVLDLLEHAARQQGIALELDAVPNVPPVRADVDELQQVVLNLVKNALEATAPGGRITVSLRPTARAAADGTTRASARLEVVDTGTGMDEATLARLFEPFFTTRAASGGSGLGLAVIKSIVVAHGGTVAASSVRGVGSRFTVELPAAEADDAGSETAAESAAGINEAAA